ncbi:hypothetical protein HYALB_00006157 [Hymenoscyphus albidus]|uniref:Mitochondrial fission process protein 1 n=1 Tax=Hymenoscyphus albidus TaxID=595503 RepID=A0A9N9LJM1_9HELO|nr:hypothetical protein HYALB_00006157 [Hymenoscyphus albidus]
MAGSDSEKDNKGRGPPPTVLPEPAKLPKGLQDIEGMLKSHSGPLFGAPLIIHLSSAPQTTESSIRYAAYATRIRTALLSAQRYVAYTSDIGESFRPVAHPNLVRSAYGVSWAYIAGDVAHEGYKAYCSNQRILHPELPRVAAPEKYNDAKSTIDPVAGEPPVPGKVPALSDWRTVALQRGVFQSIASMGLPAFTIHSIVRYSGRALKDNKSMRIRTYGPIGLGLAAVPALPYLFDKPVEEAVEWVFHKGFETFGGKEAVGDLPAVGREKMLEKDNMKATKEKEL